MRYSFERVVEMRWLPGSIHAAESGRRYTSHCACPGDSSWNAPHKLQNYSITSYFSGSDAKCDRCGEWTWYYVNELLFAQDIANLPIPTCQPNPEQEPVIESDPRAGEYSITANIYATIHHSCLTVDGEMKKGVKEDLNALLREIEQTLKNSGLFKEVKILDWED